MAEFQNVAKVKDVPLGLVRIVEVDGRRLALCNANGEFFAVEDRCTHDDGPLGEGLLEDGEIECPRHGARFDVRTGQATCLPAVVPVQTFAVRVQADDIQVALVEK